MSPVLVNVNNVEERESTVKDTAASSNALLPSSYEEYFTIERFLILFYISISCKNFTIVQCNSLKITDCDGIQFSTSSEVTGVVFNQKYIFREREFKITMHTHSYVDDDRPPMSYSEIHGKSKSGRIFRDSRTSRHAAPSPSLDRSKNVKLRKSKPSPPPVETDTPMVESFTSQKLKGVKYNAKINREMMVDAILNGTELNPLISKYNELKSRNRPCLTVRL